MYISYWLGVRSGWKRGVDWFKRYQGERSGIAEKIKNAIVESKKFNENSVVEFRINSKDNKISVLIDDQEVFDLPISLMNKIKVINELINEHKRL